MAPTPQAQPIVVLDVQPTPNPNAMKFVLNRPISDRPISFLTRESSQSHPLARELFSAPGVTSVLLLGDFVTVNKAPEENWRAIVARVKKILTR